MGDPRLASFGQGLSPTQYRVLRLFAMGYTRKAIAVELHMGIGTVRAHIAIAYIRLGVHCMADAFRALGWLTVPDA